MIHKLGVQLASFPGSHAWMEKREPGMHCLLIAQFSLEHVFSLGFLEWCAPLGLNSNYDIHSATRLISN